jgi:hypothetical protein
MARGRTLSLKVESEIKGLDKLGKVGDKLGKVGRDMTRNYTLPIVAAGAAAVKFASDLEQSTMKARQVFTSESDRIIRAAQNLDDSFSEATFLDTTGTFGALLQNMGLTEKAAADLSLEWLGLAEDMASFHNTDPAAALGAIQSALAGEFEPLKRYGVMLNAARLEQVAFESGVWDGVGALTDQERILAINTELFRQQPKVLGDAARSEGTLADETRELTANLEDSAAALGKELLPFAAEFVDTLGGLVRGFADLPDPVKDSVVQFAALLAVAGPLLIVGGKVLTVVRNLAPAFVALGTSTFGPIAAVVAALAVARSELTQFLDEATFDTTGLLQEQFGTDPLGDLFSGGNGPTASFEVEIVPELTVADDFGTRHLTPFIDEVTETLETGADNAASVFAEVLGEAPQRTADALLANQFVLGDRIDELIAYMDASLTPAQQVFDAQGFLMSQELADGLVSNNPYVRTKAQEMQAAAIAALKENLYLAMDSGAALAATYAAGIVNNLGVVQDAGRQLAWSVASQARIESEPPDPNSPLHGITKWGENIARTLAAGMDSGNSIVRDASQRLTSAVVAPTVGTPRPQRSAGVLGGIVGGNVTNINLTFTGDPPDARDERELVASLQRIAPFIDGRMASGY